VIKDNCVSLSLPSREEYGKLFDFVNAKKLNIKNRGFKEVMHQPLDTSLFDE